MDEATRRSLLFGKEIPEQTGGPARRLSELADGMAAGLEGLRQLQEAGFEAPGELEYERGEGDLDYAEAEGDWSIEPTVEAEEQISSRARLRLLLICLGVFVVALLPRLYFLYVATDPDVMIPSWSNDTWHRWQIAYLTKEIGLRQDPARLWDLKGLEYFWGVVHPLISSALFSLTGSVDVMVLRWMTLAAGGLNIVFLYLLGRKHWGEAVGLGAAALGALNPIIIFNDPSGMVEPLSFLFLLAGLHFFPRRSLLAGLLLGLAAMTRAEAWLMSAGLLLAALFARENWSRKSMLIVGWALPVGLYMKHLLDVTGNALYPIYWNFLANAAGHWEFREGYTDYQLAARPVLAGIFALAALASLALLIRRPRGYLIFLLGSGTTTFITGFIGLTHYLESYEPWFWLTRFFVFPYLFSGLLIAVLVFDWLPKRAPSMAGRSSGVGLLACVALAWQFTWPAVMRDVNPGYTSQTSGRLQQQQARAVSDWYNGGTVLIPEGAPQFTYALVRYGGIDAHHLMGQMYGPDYYYQGGDPLENWDEVGPLMWDWFQRNDVRMLVMDVYDQRFLRMIQDSPGRFTRVDSVPGRAMDVYWVDPGD
jgi:hypothetical protein